jgi:hypothetical protein
MEVTLVKSLKPEVFNLPRPAFSPNALIQDNKHLSKTTGNQDFSMIDEHLGDIYKKFELEDIVRRDIFARDSELGPFKRIIAKQTRIKWRGGAPAGYYHTGKTFYNKKNKKNKKTEVGYMTREDHDPARPRFQIDGIYLWRGMTSMKNRKWSITAKDPITPFNVQKDSITPIIVQKDPNTPGLFLLSQ